jgi:hypothetical protein
VNIQLPFTVWDFVAAVAQALSTFWAASPWGLRIIICVLVVFRLWAGPQPETNPRRHRRRRYRNRWDD